MWIDKQPLQFITAYLQELEKALKEQGNAYRLSSLQRLWLGFCLMGILLTNSICWAKFERMSFKRYSQAALSWMFLHSKLPWERLLVASVSIILKRFGISEGVAIIDDKDIERSKNAKQLFRLYKTKDKKTGGYILGQNIVVLYFVSNKICLPIGFSFYSPDPELKKWAQEVLRLKKEGVSKRLWPSKPERSLDHPKKYELAIELLSDFKKRFAEIKVHAVLADGLFGHLPFIQGVEALWENVQVITKMRKKQKIQNGNKEYSCEGFSHSYKGWEQDITIRGRNTQKVIAGGGGFFVPSHQTKRFVIAMKYQGESECRYLMASNLSWNMKRIMEIFSLRWLIEVFFEDWSCYNGFCSLAKQCGEEGSLRPLILSLLFDHCFFFHKQQALLLENHSSLATFGTLVERTRAEAFCHFIYQILEDDSPKAKLQELVDNLDEVFPLRSSKKHFSGVPIDFEIAKKTA
jgi:hypothetical protein